MSTTAQSAPRPFITANRITVARILLLPFPCWALLTRPEESIMWVAFVFGVLVGATDFVDGWLARRQGPTILGSLLDPVADKLFVCMLLVPTVATGDCPGWAAGLLFVRELLITELRSALSVRGESLKTSQLGKLKTVAQMGGIGTFFLTIFVPMPWMVIVHAACASALTLVIVFYAVVKRRWAPTWILGGAPMWWMVTALGWFLPAAQAGYWQFLMMVALTWISGADYLVGASRILRATGVHTADVARIVWSFVHGLALLPLLGEQPALAVPAIVVLCAELSFGGIENIVSVEQKRYARGSVVPTAVGAVVVGACAWLDLVPSGILLAMAWGLAALSVVNALVAFVLDRQVFMSLDRRPLAD